MLKYEGIITDIDRVIELKTNNTLIKEEELLPLAYAPLPWAKVRDARPPSTSKCKLRRSK